MGLSEIPENSVYGATTAAAVKPERLSFVKMGALDELDLFAVMHGEFLAFP
jgi:hypothetical protein